MTVRSTLFPTLRGTLRPSLGFGAGFSGLLDLYPGAAAAYSLRALSSGWLAGDVVEVRRSSDGTLQGFTASQILNGEMLDWVNADLITYSSDFSVDTDGTTASGSTLTANQSVGGEDDALLVTVDSGTSTHEVRKAGLDAQGYSLSFEYYIPSSNTDVDGIEVSDSGVPAFITEASPTLDQWNTASSTTTVIGNAFRFRSLKAGANNFTGNGTDVFYVKNIVITQTTADGFVSTWYDQSGNANDATQITTTAQPKIVDAGSLVAYGIDFDGVDDVLDFDSAIDFSNGDWFATSVVKWDGSIAPILGGGISQWSLSISTPTNFSARATNDSVIHNLTPSSNFVSGAVTLASTYRSSDVLYGSKDGAEVSGSNPVITSGDTFNAERIGLRGALYSSSPVAEVIIYNSDQYANRVGIETNINDHYSIY